MTVFVPKKKQRSNSLPEMTLRDYFAAKAMQGLLSSDMSSSHDQFAELAYRQADAMIKAREQN